MAESKQASIGWKAKIGFKKPKELEKKQKQDANRDKERNGRGQLSDRGKKTGQSSLSPGSQGSRIHANIQDATQDEGAAKQASPEEVLKPEYCHFMFTGGFR